MGLKAMCEALGASLPSLALQSTAWAVPAVQSLHILALSVVLASMAMLSVRMMGLAGGRRSLAEAALRFLPATWAALVVLLATGAVLILAEPARELLNPTFWWKMALLVVAVAASILLKRAVERDPDDPGARRLVGAAFLALWLAIAVLGRWIAYVDTGL